MQDVHARYGAAMSEYIEFGKRAAAGFVKTGSFIAGWAEDVRIHVVTLAPPEHFQLRGSVIVTHTIARTDVDREVGYVDAAGQRVAACGEFQIAAYAPGHQGTGYVHLRRLHSGLVSQVG